MTTFPDVEDSWTRIVTWCERYAPEAVRTLRPPAGEEALAAAEAASGCEWPEDLRRWYRLHDGCREYPYSRLMAPWMPLPLEGIVAEVRHQAAVLADLSRMPWADPSAVERSRAEPAGVVPNGFLPSFVPIAVDLQEGTLYVDTRPGPWSGCVTEYGDHSGRRWDSVQEMLAEIADVLASDGTSDHRRPRTVSGWLEWETVQGPNREPREGSSIEEPELSDEEAVRRLRESAESWEPAGWSTEPVGESTPEPVVGFEPDTLLRDAVIAELDRNRVPELVADIPLGRLDALFWASQGAPSGFLPGVLARWGVAETHLVLLDGAMNYHLVGDQTSYTATDRGAAAVTEALRMPFFADHPAVDRLLNLSPAEFARHYADWAVANYHDGQLDVNFFDWAAARL